MCESVYAQIPLTETDEEEWRPVPGFEGVYDVSNRGQVRRIAPGPGAVVGRILKQSKNSDGYLGLQLSNHDHRVWTNVHPLVCEAFHGPRPEGYVCNHLDGIKTHNESSNLEWTSVRGNAEHASRMGLYHPRRGEAHHHARLTEKEAREILAAKGTASCEIIAKRYGVSDTLISDIHLRRRWKHLG